MGLGAVDSEGIGLRAQVGACPGRPEPPGATPRGASGSLTRNVSLSGVSSAHLPLDAHEPRRGTCKGLQMFVILARSIAV